MTLYIYKTETSTPALTLENIVSYTTNQAVAKDGTVYGPFAPGYEFSSVEDCSEALRAELPAPMDLEAENRLMREQIAVCADRQEFLEDCIAEMAVQVYGV